MRQTGETTYQIKVAPQNAIYVWVNDNTNYPQSIAENLGRKDIEFVPPSWLCMCHICGRNNLVIIIDHAVTLTSGQLRAFQEYKIRERFKHMNMGE